MALGNPSLKLGLQGTWPGPHLGSVAEPGPAACTARGRTGVGRVPRQGQQRKPSGVTEPETIRILPEAGPGSSPQPDHEEQPEHLGLGTNLPWEQWQRGGRSNSVRGDGVLGLLASTKAHPTTSQNNPQTVKRSDFFPKKLWTRCQRRIKPGRTRREGGCFCRGWGHRVPVGKANKSQKRY